MAMPQQPSRPPHQDGLSLVELMVASLVLGIIVIGVTSMLGSGQRMGYGNDLRRQARIRVAAVLEDSAYNRPRHDAAYAAAPIVSADPVVPLDSGRAVPVPATLRVRFHDEATFFRDPVNGGGPVPVHYYRVRTALAWTFEGAADSIVLTRRIPRI